MPRLLREKSVLSSHIPNGDREHIRETSPQRTEILSASQGTVRIEDTISSVEESRVTRLEFHSVEYQLHGEVATGGGDARARAEGWGELSLVTVLILKIPHDFVQDASPD